jgi:hypothetical protein
MIPPLTEIHLAGEYGLGVPSPCAAKPAHPLPTSGSGS